MNFLNKITDLFKDNRQKELDDNANRLIQILANAICIDEKITEEEIKEAINKLNDYFKNNEERENKFKEKMFSQIEIYKKNKNKLKKDKDEIINYILQNNRTDLAYIIKKIYFADGLDNKGREQEVLNRLNDLIKKREALEEELKADKKKLNLN